MDWSQWVLIGFIALLIIAYPILVSTRNKKENQKLQEQTNSLKRGDKVLTTSGVYGTVVDLQMDNDKKIVTIETGSGVHKSYMAVDAYAIYTVLRDEDKTAKTYDKKAKADSKAETKAEQTKVVEAKSEQKEVKSDKKEQKPQEKPTKTEKPTEKK